MSLATTSSSFHPLGPEQTEVILDSVASGVLTVDLDGRITYFNKGEQNKARKCFTKVLDIDPDDELALSCLARLGEVDDESKRGFLSRFFG